MKDQVEIVEVGPRDGLQALPGQVSHARKVALVDGLSALGFGRIECASFVSARWVPQMAGSAEVMAGISRRPGVAYMGLTPNLRGFERALAAGCDWVAVFASASEGFSRANLNASVAESLVRFEPVVQAAREAGVPVRGYVSCVTDCPFDGPVSPGAVARVVQSLADMGCAEVSLGETLGRGRPEAVAAMLDGVVQAFPVAGLAGHFHDTMGLALDNVDVALDRGVRIFDTSIGGLGGCPYAPGAAGNLATETLDAHLRQSGFDTGLDPSGLAKLVPMARAIALEAKAEGTKEGAE